MTMHISIYLGEDEQQAAARKAALEALALKAGHEWNGKPSVGRWLCALADERIQGEMTDQLPKLRVKDTQIIHQNDLNIKLATGAVLNHGYSLAVTLGYNDQATVVSALNLLVTADQSAAWCISQCERLAAELAQQDYYTPGQIVRILHCGFRSIASLGIPVPPVREHTTARELKEFHERTDKPMIYQENEAWHKYAVAFNAWIKEYPALAEDYECTPADENWVPVK
jgi:hypothetical protein